jgi:glycosyltransferase involved in cell wall biosynthesis
MESVFSIVIANYNHGRFLEQAILSIINQKFDSYELIIIDGGSSDNSIDIIKKYEKYISYWVSESDKGQSDAFNKGFSHATGQFYFWLNADDVLLPDSLVNIYNAINKNPQIKWFAANTIFFDETNKILSCKRGPNWNSFLIKNAHVYVYGPSTIFHKNLFKNSGGFDLELNYTMDTDFWMRLISNGEHFKRISKYVWGFRIHGSSKTSHTFKGPANDFMSKENIFIVEKNNWKYSLFKIKLQFLYKLIGTTYFLSLIDTYRLKNKDINFL